VEGDDDEEEMLRRAIEASRIEDDETPPPPAAPSSTLPQDAMTSLLQAMYQAQQQQQAPPPPQATMVPLNNVVTTESLESLLEDAAVVQELVQQLPEGQQTSDELRRTISCPQLRASLRALTGALMSDNYNAVLANFGLDPAAGAEALARGDTVLAFLQALQQKADLENGGEKQ
jgi:hypothetical protein